MRVVILSTLLLTFVGPALACDPRVAPCLPSDRERQAAEARAELDAKAEALIAARRAAESDCTGRPRKTTSSAKSPSRP